MANGPINEPPYGRASGTVFRGADGSLYFVRDTLLDALRVEGDSLTMMTVTLDRADPCEVEQFAGPTSAPSAIKNEIQPIAYIKGSLLMQGPSPGVAGGEPVKAQNGGLLASARFFASAPGAAVQTAEPAQASTIMCPWFC